MINPEFPHEFTIASAIIDCALADAVKEAIEAEVSRELFYLTVLYHVCFGLVDVFNLPPKEIGQKARSLADLCVRARDTTPLKH
jgi:hypothetical protein